MAKQTPMNCRCCGSAKARRYQVVSPGAVGEGCEESELLLCVRCARAERKRLVQQQPSEAQRNGLTRGELIAELDRFFEASGALEICRRCHEQGTGCCPPSCRVMGARGCDPANKLGKTLFCATFVCSALLNAISESDPETGRTIKWLKKELGQVEFRIYEMIARVPMSSREGIQPLVLPRQYPKPAGIRPGVEINEKLTALTEEVLEIRRRWRKCEELES